MTMGVAIGTLSPAVQSRTADKADRNAEVADERFEDVIDRKTGKRSAANDAAHAPGTRPASSLERLMASFGITDEDGLPVEEQQVEREDDGVDATLADVDVLVDETSVIVGRQENGAADDFPDDGGTASVVPVVQGGEKDSAGNGQADEQPATVAMPASEGEVPLTVANSGHVASTAKTTTQAAAIAGASQPLASSQQKQGIDTPASGRNQPQGPNPVAATGGDEPASTVQRAAADTARAVAPATAFRGNGDGESRFGDGSGRAASAGDTGQPRVNVLGFTAAIAPASTTNPLLGQTAAGLVAAMEGDQTWRSAALDSATQAGQRAHLSTTGVNTLRIQLNPVELGTVTAKLTAAGEQLSVEIQVESNEARQRLASDSDSILKVLRAVGYDIEKVIVTQSSQSASANAQQGTAGRDQFAANQQTQGEGGTAGGDGGRGTGKQDGEATRHAGEKTPDSAGGSLYI